MQQNDRSLAGGEAAIRADTPHPFALNTPRRKGEGGGAASSRMRAELSPTGHVRLYHPRVTGRESPTGRGCPVIHCPGGVTSPNSIALIHPVPTVAQAGDHPRGQGAALLLARRDAFRQRRLAAGTLRLRSGNPSPHARFTFSVEDARRQCRRNVGRWRSAASASAENAGTALERARNARRPAPLSRRRRGRCSPPPVCPAEQTCRPSRAGTGATAGGARCNALWRTPTAAVS